MAKTMTIPLKSFSDKDYTQAVIDIDKIIGEDFDWFHIDYIARVGDHLELAYTVKLRRSLLRNYRPPHG
jgi:hypothetical protein